MNLELDAIKGFKVEAKREATSIGEAVVIKDDNITEKDEESNKPILTMFLVTFKGLLPLEYYHKFIPRLTMNSI